MAGRECCDFPVREPDSIAHPRIRIAWRSRRSSQVTSQRAENDQHLPPKF